MIRHCDGNDPNLIRMAGDSYQPCDCGQTFDDVERLTVHPHEPVSGSPDRLEWTPEQITEFQAEMEKAAAEPIRVLPPRWPTPDELRSFLRDNVTVVKPGETLVIRIGEEWHMTPNQMREIQDMLIWNHEHGFLPFRSLVVPGTGLGVVEAGPEQ